MWAQGDGSTLGTYDTHLGRIGGLICWENYMPLARYALYAWGTEIYVAATWDHGEPWLSTLRHIAKGDGVYVIGCCMALRRDDIPAHGEETILYAQIDPALIGGLAGSSTWPAITRSPTCSVSRRSRPTPHDPLG